MNCPSCQKEIADNSRFCYLCGARLVAQAPQPQPAPGAGPRRLYRSANDRKIGGVCGGVAEYMELDPSMVRVITFLLVFFTGIGFLAYLAAWLIIPLGPDFAPPLSTAPPRRLYRSATDKKIGGVCGGVAEYLGVDPTVVRVIWLLASFTFIGFVAYLILWMVTPLGDPYAAGYPAAAGNPSQ